MRRCLCRLAALLPLVLLCGCTEPGNPEVPDRPKEAVTEASAQSETEVRTYETGDVLPVLSIRTVSQAENVMDFVTKPVAAHVSSQIASWTPGYRKPPAPYYETCTVTLTEPGGSVTLSVDCDVKVRGNWTTSYDKKPLRLKFAEKQNLLGLNDGAEMKNWVLLAGYKDGSLLRDKTALAIADELLGADGLYAADSTLVEVEINGEYWGVYLLTEQQQVNPHRVAVTEPEKDYAGTDIGYFLEFDGYSNTEDALHSFPMNYADNAPLLPFEGYLNPEHSIRPCQNGKGVGITIKSDIYSQEQHDFIANYTDQVYRILYAAAYEDTAYSFDAAYAEISETPDLTPQQAVEAVIDVESLADMYLLSELTCDADLYWSSFFMDVDFGAGGDKRLRFEAPWDFDSGLGNKDRCADGTGFYAASIIPDVNGQNQEINPWLAVLIHEAWFQEIIREKWTAAYDSGVFDRAVAQIGEDTQAYAPAFTRNYDRWDNLRHNEAQGELCRRAAHCMTHEQAADYLTEWLESRITFLNGFWHA